MQKISIIIKIIFDVDDAKGDNIKSIFHEWLLLIPLKNWYQVCINWYNRASIGIRGRNWYQRVYKRVSIGIKWYQLVSISIRGISGISGSGGISGIRGISGVSEGIRGYQGIRGIRGIRGIMCIYYCGYIPADTKVDTSGIIWYKLGINQYF